MRMHSPHLLALALLPAAACVSSKISGYLDDAADCTTSQTAGTGTDSTATDIASEPIETSTEAGSTSASSSDDSTTGTSTTDPSDPGGDDSSTGPAEPVCGDGVLADFGDVPEECDDGNLVPDDGCDATCARDIRVFVTSKTFKAGDLGGLYTADAQCRELAEQAGLLAGSRFQAWLSDSTTDARDWLTPGRGRLVLVNGLVLAASWDALLAGELQRPIDVTENSETYHGGVWTGTRPDGTRVPDSGHCLDWTANSPIETAYYGDSDQSSSEWTLADEVFNPSDCLALLAIYCFEEFL